MFGKVKRWLGIEGVKVELEIPDEVPAEQGSVEGTIRFYSMHDQVVKSIKVRMIERYKRGRRKNKLVDEYTLGEIALEQEIAVPAHETIEVDFSLPFDLALSDIDNFERKNFVFKGIAKTAKLLKGVRSVYRLEAEAEVKGTALNPFDKREFSVVF